jgi:hypothetical protein
MVMEALAIYRGGRATRGRHAEWPYQREAATSDHDTPGSQPKAADGKQLCGDMRLKPILNNYENATDSNLQITLKFSIKVENL